MNLPLQEEYTKKLLPMNKDYSQHAMTMELAPTKFFLVNGHRIASLRSRKLMTQEDLARKTGLSLGQIKKIEPKERNSIYLSTAKKLAEALDMDPEEFIAQTGAGEPIKSKAMKAAAYNDRKKGSRPRNPHDDRSAEG